MPTQPKDKADVSSKASPTFHLTPQQHLERADALEKLGPDHAGLAQNHRSLAAHMLRRQRKDESPSA
jgi:hypothetical protein